MDKLINEPLVFVFFVYGLSFMVMGGLIMSGIVRATSIALISSFYMLVFFGFAHGITELTDWVRVILRTLGSGENDVLVYISQFFLILSFVLLLQFGVNLLTYKSEKKIFIRSIPFVLLGVYLVIIYSLGITDVLKIGLFARYSFGIAGSALSAIVLFRLGRSMKALENKSLVRGLNITALGFACYAVFGGLIVKPIFDLPIQFFRAACAITIALASSSILDIFKVEQ